MFDKLDLLEKRYEELGVSMSRPEVVANLSEYQKHAKEYSDLAPTIRTYREYKRVLKEIEESRRLLTESDGELRDLARQELAALEGQKAEYEKNLRFLLLPKDPNDAKNIFLEIRAGTGGEEASLFVADLFRMYAKYSERQGWKIGIVSQSPTGLGGFKEIIASVEGRDVYARLKFESGTHRVQRVPVTEASGRIHTSAATVAVLPEAEEVDVDINPSELRIDVYRSSGPGGQSVNTTDSAVRVTHIPTGLIVTCQDEKSQHKNRAKALRVLRARLLDQAKRDRDARISQERRLQIGSGDRSERIRTYNYPQGRVTDHRINLTLYKLEAVLDGELDPLVGALEAADQSEALAQMEVQSVLH
ncbi:MAG TPA: peptide chain release factor 1 [bacterium]|nr:peptide chain release factor 1 [bacterium]